MSDVMIGCCGLHGDMDALFVQYLNEAKDEMGSTTHICGMREKRKKMMKYIEKLEAKGSQMMEQWGHGGMSNVMIDCWVRWHFSILIFIFSL